MLPIPETRVWSSSARFTPVRLVRSRATTASRSNSGSNGSRAMWATSSGSSAPPGDRLSPPNIRWSTNRRSGSPSVKTNRTRVFGGAGKDAESDRNWPLMPRCASSASPSVNGSQRYLPRRRGSANVRPTSWAAKSAGPGRWRRTGRSCRTSTRAMVRSRTAAVSPRRTTSTSGSSGIWVGGRSVGGGDLAGLIAAGGLLRGGGRIGPRGLLSRGGLVRLRGLGQLQPGGDGLERDRGGVLLGLLLVPAGAGAEPLVAEHDPRLKRLGVIRAGLADLV